MRDPSLLSPDEPATFRVAHEHGPSPFLLTCDHAGALVPRRLSSLGLSAQDLRRHIAWDIGAAGVTTRLAARLDAFAILQTYSRLVIDCNRPLDSEESMLRVSEGTRIPGNESISPPEAQAREREVFRPYHDRIRAELESREAQQRPAILIAMHSFTPVFHGRRRPWHAGVLYNRDHRLATAVLRRLRLDQGLVIGDNYPYSVSDHSDYALPVYGEQRGLLHVGIELRQDLVAEPAGQDQWAQRLAQVLPAAVAELAA